MITRPNFKAVSISKDTFVTLFLILTLILVFFPFLATFNDLLTRLVINLKGYSFIRDYIVPTEVRMVAVILVGFFGFLPFGGLLTPLSLKRGIRYEPL